MRVMTSGAGKPVTAFLLTFALEQRLPLAGRSAFRTQFAGADKVSYIIGEILARKEVGQRASRDVDGCLAFQVALQAYGISLAG
jgi:hypothetical protein